MDSGGHKLFLAMLPKVPLIVRVVIMHMLSLSPPSQYLNLRSELIIAIIRSFLQPSSPRSITATQKLALKDHGIKGDIWVAKTASPALDDADANALLSSMRGAIDALLEPGAPTLVEPAFIMPAATPVEAEWTGFRSDATPDSVLPPDMSEPERFANLMKETTTPTTVLYFHGGAYYLLDPSGYRSTTCRLAKMTGGRVYSVRYRLAPQHPFPAALVDALISYLTLLYPPKGSLHLPVDPAHIVFAGDSSGGNLCFALTQLVIQLRRQGSEEMSSMATSTNTANGNKKGNIRFSGGTIRWQGKDVTLPLPAGVAVNSPWLDITQSSPTWEAEFFQKFDYLPPPSRDVNHARLQGRADCFSPPTCAAWPANPDRASMYVADSLLAHPLVSPVMAGGWEEAPPVWMCVGWEMLAAEGRWMAGRLVKDGVRVVLEQYEAMPHCFAMVLGDTEETRRCFEGWAGFMREVVGVEGGDGGKGKGGDREEKNIVEGVAVMEEADDREEEEEGRETSKAKAEGRDDDGGIGLGGRKDGGVETRFFTIKAKSLKEVEIPVDEVTTLSDEAMRERVRAQAAHWVSRMRKDKVAKL